MSRYSSLLILEALMVEVRRLHTTQQKDLGRTPAKPGAEPLRSHDVLDYIYGASSGGLIAIMLGRLKMLEKECMETFETYCGMIFSRPRPISWLLGGAVFPQYSGKRLMKATKLVVGEFDRSPEAKKWRRNLFSSPGEHCKTRQNVAASIAKSQTTLRNKPIDLGENLEDVGDLGDWIVADYQRSQFPVGTGEREFLPEGCLEKLITRASVVAAMSLPSYWERMSTGDKELVNFIVESAKKVFAITITTGISRNGPELYKAMLVFKAHGFGDASLPVQPHSWAPNVPLVKELYWKRGELLRFMHHQWTYLAPIFPEEIWDTDLEPDCILPFTTVNARRATAFSSIYRVTVHPSHQEHPVSKANGEADFALKDIESHHWEAEANALKQISSLGHPHLITLKAMIRQGGKCYFMFPWADGGNLREFYEKNDRPRLQPGLIREIFQQLSGLADAVDAMHHPGHGDGPLRHGDLKPENILIFLDESQVGVWKIADLSLAKYHLIETPSRHDLSDVFGTLLYEPPDSYTMRNEPRSRRHDLWSMGCIYLELLIWLLYGYKELTTFWEALKTPGQEFYSRDHHFWYFDQNTREAELHPNVVKYMEHIAKDLELVGSSAIRDLLDLIRTRLLVINLNEGSVIRADSRELRSALADILAEGEKNEQYWFTGTLGDGIRGPP
ncbi:kinase-like domain-containing protein [Xylaria digitata]|nr:kinase-like domain-containing protein [Xylaria digitata]